MHGRRWTRQEGLDHLDNPERRRHQDPEAFWRKVGLSPGTAVAEIGAGTGFFALPAAQAVGPAGKVYAVDISDELVELLKERQAERGMTNLFPVLSTAERIPLADGLADVVLLANVLHDIPPSTASEAVRLLKKGGRLINVDWKKTETPGGPPVSVRFTEAEATRRLEAMGLRHEKAWEFGPHHYVLEFRKP